MDRLTNRLLIAVSSLGLVILLCWLMVIGRSLLVPFVIAVVIWYLLINLAYAARRIPFGTRQWHMPLWMGLIIAIGFVIVFLSLLIAIVSETVRQLGSQELQTRYNDQFVQIVDRLENALIYPIAVTDTNGNQILNQTDPTWLQQLRLGERLDFSSVRGFEAGNFISQLVTRVMETVQADGLSSITSSATDVLRWASQLFGPISGVVVTTTVILLYTAFLLVETSTFDQKLRALANNDDKTYDYWREIIERIGGKISSYLRIKTFTSALTGLLGYGVLKLFDVDFAEFWGLLLFLLNYIPIIGSFIATILPVFVALVQPGIGLGATSLIAIMLMGIQQGIGSVMEPRLMGDTLNLSPLVILISLALFGTLWGVTGALLSVPLISIITILLASFKSTHWVAVILSRNGKIE